MKSLAFATSLSLLPACAVAGSDRYEHQLSEMRKLADDDAATEKRADNGEPFAGAATLDRETLLAEVLARNPSLNAARHAWRAALARFPQTTALHDPMASYMFAPLSIGSALGGGVPFGQEVMLTQPLPFPGKLELRGAGALAEADAMRGNFEATRLGLALMAAMFHADYFKNGAELTVNDEHAALLTAMRDTLRGRFEAGGGSLQGPLGAELELVHIERDRVRLLSERDVLVARINELLHRAPSAELPPPPRALAVTELGEGEEASSQALFDEALKNRPELASLRARIKGAQAEIDLAEAESWPDFSLSASYNSMWNDVEHQFMVGGSIEIPIQIGTRAAVIEQAESKRKSIDAELLVQMDAVRTEIDTERRRTIEARHIVRIFDERQLPIAQAIVDAASAGVETDRTSFLDLLESERALRTAKLERATAVAALQQQTAKLERAVGRVGKKPAQTEREPESESESGPAPASASASASKSKREQP